MKAIGNRPGPRPGLSLGAAIRMALIVGAGGVVLIPAITHADSSGDGNTLDEVVVTATRR